MFTVKGSVYGEKYSVTRNDDGTLTGTPLVLELLENAVGASVVVPPVGPVYTLDPADPKSVVAGLLDLTTVDSITGNAPEVVPPPEPGVVY